MISLVRETVLGHGWLTEGEFLSLSLIHILFLNAEKGSLQKQAESGLFAQTCDLIWTMPT